jgi:hypothetical protein
LSLLSGHIANGASPSPTSAFYRARPQILKSVLTTLQQAVSATIAVVGEQRILEPRFTRQLAVDFERIRATTPGAPRYDIVHQPELPILDRNGTVVRYRRLDIRLLFLRQVGAPGDYLGLECKYLDAGDRSTDADYVDDGVERIVCGDYSRHHPWAIMVGLERRGPIHRTAANVDARLRERYGDAAGFKPSCRVRLQNIRESEHLQGGGPHRISILHGFYLIAASPS